MRQLGSMEGFLYWNLKYLIILKVIQQFGKENPWKTWRKIDKLSAYKHFGFWQSMDSLRDKQVLEEFMGGKYTLWKKW